MSSRDTAYQDPEIFGIPVKLYFCHEVVIEVCRERGLRCQLIRAELQQPFMVVRVFADRESFTEARCEWCRRISVYQFPMNSPMPENKPKEKAELF